MGNGTGVISTLPTSATKLKLTFIKDNHEKTY